jgi:hypothetical protein
MLASTVQFSTHNQPTTHHQTPAPTPHRDQPVCPRSCLAVPKQQPPDHRPAWLFLQDPTGCPSSAPAAPRPVPHPHSRGAVLGRRRPLPGRTRQCLRPRAPHHHIRAARAPAPGCPGQALLRKEVIQPHLPVRLPCYDFVPIASPTFDGSPPHGLGHRLRVLPTFVT